MLPPSPPSRGKLPYRFLSVAALVAVVAALALRPVVLALVARRIRAVAAARAWTAHWRSLELTAKGQLALSDLTFLDAHADTALYARSARLGVSPVSLVLGHPRPSFVAIEDARAWIRPRPAPDPDTLAPEPAPRASPSDRSRKIAHAVEAALELMLVPAHRLPRIALRDLEVVPVSQDEALLGRVEIARLDVAPSASGTRLVAGGALTMEERMPFGVALDYGRDGRLSGRSSIVVPSGAARETLRLAIDGNVQQNRHDGVVRLGDSTRVRIGALPLRVSGSIARKGPHITLALAADRVTEPEAHASLPRVMLGPLFGVSVRGSFDYRLGFDLDLEHPEKVEFTADVIPHGLALNLARTSLNLATLDQPFVAEVHLPHDRHVFRELSPANPHYRPLADIDSTLAHAVITNEDGGFYRHHGFNTEAVKSSIAENIRAGAFRRGAGTITMQLVRNLWLGHRRTLSRKMQEVVLAWVLENLTGISKQRLLEIYLNIIEWGPSVFGADEAATYYFGHDAGRLSVPEALFLTTVVPAPNKWRYRFAPDGALRPFEREQMHFIGRAMIAKGWLDAEKLPPVDSLRVVLRGAAHDVLFPPADTTTAAPLEPHS